MAQTLTSKIAVSLTAALSDPLELASRGANVSYAKAWSLASGVAANQADKIFHDQREISASGTEDLDLAAVLLDPFGAAITFAKIKAVLIYAAAGNTNNVNVTRPSSNGVPLFLAAGDGIAVLPGGLFLWIAPNLAGVAVTGGTGDLLTFTNSAGTTTVTYDVFIIGTSA